MYHSEYKTWVNCNENISTITILQLNVETTNYNCSYNYAYHKRKKIKLQIQIHKTKPEAKKKYYRPLTLAHVFFHNKIAYYCLASKIYKNCRIVRKLISCAKDQTKAYNTFSRRNSSQ